MPTGAGIVVEQVEAGITAPGEYLPDPTAFPGKTFIDETGLDSISPHATTVGSYFYASPSSTQGSFAPGISTIDCYFNTDWLANVVGVQSSSAPALPPSNDPSIINCSWNQTDTTDPAYDIDALRRMDYMIDRDHTLVTVAVQYPFSPAVPALMASSYNAISVGLLNGTSSVGPTIYGDVPGRSKPDIVGQEGATSYNAPEVAGTAAMLMQVINQTPTFSAAVDNPTIIKAILMASANKDAVAHFNRTPTQPLDPVFGSGLLNVQASYNILLAGPQLASTSSIVASTGWSVASIGLGQTQTYYLNVPAGAPYNFSALVTWERQIALTPGVNGAAATLTPSMAQIDLNLYQVTSGFNLGTLVDSSVSSIDNVQDVFERYLQPGRYAVQLSRADSLSTDPGNYGLAWQLTVAGSSTWAATVSGSWSNAGNWIDGAPNAQAAAAAFTASGTSAVTVTLDAPQTVGTLLLSNTASTTTGYVLNGAGANTLTMNNSGSGATISLAGGSHQIDATFIIADSGGLTVCGSGTLAFGSAGSITDNRSGYSLTMNAAAGALILAGSSSYSGGTNLAAGMLLLANGTTGSATGSGNVTLNGGTLASSAVTGASIGGSLIAGTGPHVIVPGNGGFGVLKVGGSVSLNSNSTLDFNVNGLNYNQLAIAGNLSVTGTANLNLALATLAGPYDLITFASSAGLALNDFHVAGLVPGYKLVLQSTDLALISTGTAIWTAPGGSWNAAANWSTLSAPGGVGALAVMSSTATSPTTITLDTPQTLGSLVFDNTGGYTLAPGVSGSLTMSNTGGAPGKITVLDGSQTITAPLKFSGSAASFLVSDSGDLNLAGSVSALSGSVLLTLSSPDGTGVLTLSGTNKLGDGADVVSGTLVLDGAKALAAGSSLWIGSGNGPEATAQSVSQTSDAGQANLASVPEPGTSGLLAVVVLGLSLGVWRRRKLPDSPINQARLRFVSILSLTTYAQEIARAN